MNMIEVSRRDFLKYLAAGAISVPVAAASINTEVRNFLLSALLNPKKTEAGAAALDFDLNIAELPLVKGHFFTQGALQKENGSAAVGFPVVDNRKAPLWSEYNKLGGTARLGYPISSSWIDGLGMVNQAFQNGVLRMNVSDIGKSTGVDILKISEYGVIPDQVKKAQSIEQIQKIEVAAETPIDMAKYVLQSYPGESSIFEQMTTEGPAETTITVGPTETFCGITVNPLLFTKDKLAAWWNRGGNLDLKWFVRKGFIEIDGIEYYVAVGDKRYDRDTEALVKQTSYGSLSIKNRSGGFTTIPAYVLFPKLLRINDTINSQQTYFEQCSGQGERWFANWTVWYERTQVNTPAYKGEAVAVTYLEYTDNKVWAKETWHYVENFGVVQIDVYDEKDVSSIVLQLKLKDRTVILDGIFGSGDIYGAQN